MSLCFAGVLVEYDMTKAPGHRVSSLKLRCGNCTVPKYKPMVLSAYYGVLMDEYMANGGGHLKSLMKSVKNNEVFG